MLIVTYDIQDDKMRSKFSKFLKSFGRRLQYSVFELKHSKRIKQAIMTEIKMRYERYFTNVDSVIIFEICEGCTKKILRYGAPVQEEEAVVVFE